jgi:osmoprotectant transport system substrate-binding protein
MRFHATTGLGVRAAVSCIILAGSALVGCSASEPPEGSVTTGSKGTVTIGSRNFSESVIIASMYSAVLERAGFAVEEKYNLCNRPRCLKALKNGEIDLVPEYLGSLTGQLVKENDRHAESPASGDPEATFAIVRSLVERRNLTAYQYSPASSQNAFAVSKTTAAKYGLAKLSDLAKPSIKGRLVLGGPPECPDQTYCKPGLETTYGAVFKSFAPLDVGGARTIDAISDGSVDIGLVFATDGGGGSWVGRDLILLEDDKSLQDAENIFPLIRSDKAIEEIRTPLDGVSRALTTDELRKLNRRVGIDNEDPSDVAEDFLRGKGLL